MTINELYAMLGTAIKNGFGNNYVYAYVDGTEDPISIETAYTVEAEDAADFPPLEDYVNDFIICVD